MAVLTPRLAALDEKVLAALATGRGQRSERVAAIVCGKPSYRCDGCGKVTKVGGVSVRRRAVWEQSGNSRCAKWAGGCGGVEQPVLMATAEEVREVREILRGLERIGLARQAGGWWRRAT